MNYDMFETSCMLDGSQIETHESQLMKEILGIEPKHKELTKEIVIQMVQ